MAFKLHLHGRVQGVCCRSFCEKTALRMKLHGAATNLSDGSVEVIVDTDSEEIVRTYAENLRRNRYSFSFWGTITRIDVSAHDGDISGDYRW